MNMLSRMIDLLCTINEGYWLYRIVDTVYERREGFFSRLMDRRILVWVMIGGYVLIVLGVNSFVVTSVYTVPIVIAEGTLCACLFWKCTIWDSIAVMGSYCMASILVGGTEISLTGIIGGDRLIQLTTAEQGTVRAIYLVLCGSVWYGLNSLFHRWLKKQISVTFGIRRTVYLLMLGLAGGMFFFSQLLAGFNITINIAWYVFIGVVFVASFLAYSVIKNRQFQERIRQMEAGNAMLIRNYEQLSDYYKLNAKLYHDMNHHLNAIYYMAVEDEAEQVRKYIENIIEPIDSFAIKTRTGIDVVDVVLYEAERKSQEKGISMVIEAYAVTRELAVEKQDLCALFSNLLDNAVEAAQREVKVLVKMVHGQLLIQVQNDCPDEPVRKKGRFITSKADKSRHGFGMQNIRYVVKKYDGTVDFKVQDGKFCADIVIGG